MGAAPFLRGRMIRVLIFARLIRARIMPLGTIVTMCHDFRLTSYALTYVRRAGILGDS